jgi:FkbM family methyltransferase
MREYLYNLKMAIKRHGVLKSICLITTLTVLHLKKLMIRGDSPKKDRIHGFIIHFFNYATLTGLYEEIFIQNQYYFKTKKSKPIIIDCGSNIGMSILYFKKIYPFADIIAFEPDPETFVLLKKTIEDNGFKNVKIINKAVAGRRGKAYFYSDKAKPGNLHMSLLRERVKNARASTVEKDILSYYIKGEVDFLKIDVEGAESEIISELDRTQKIKKIKLLAVEIHHNIKGSKDILNLVTGVLIKNSMKYNISAAAAVPFNVAQYQDILLFASRN